MNTTQDDGGPAFPYANPDYDGNWNTEKMIPGMTLRDYFAGMALQGMIASGEYLEEKMHDNPGVTVGQMAYLAADEMLLARKEAR